MLATTLEDDDSPPANLDKLEQQYEKTFKGNDYSRTLEIAKKMNELIEPKHIETGTTLCCLRSRVKSFERLIKDMDLYCNLVGLFVKE